MKKLTILMAAASFATAGVANDVAEIKEKVVKDHTVIAVDKFHGFDRVVFDFNGYEAWVVCPAGETRKGTPWTWCMQWATAFVPRTNVPQMLRDGYHHVTINTFKHRMDETGLKVSAAFQKYLVEKLGFAPKAYLIGMSWGGFFSVRYTNRYPQNVAKIYMDAPLLCFKDGRVGIGPWEGKEPADGWEKSPEMPRNMAESIAEADIPLLVLYGGADPVCPPDFNCEPFMKRFRAAGGDLTAVKRGLYAHHPHGVEESDCSIKRFFERPKTLPVAVYPNLKLFLRRGNRIESPKFKLDKTSDGNVWYRLSFKAKGETDGCWSVDMEDTEGKRMPGTNGRLCASLEWRDYSVLVPTCPEAFSAAVVFTATKGVDVRDVCMKRISTSDAAETAQDEYEAGPKLKAVATAADWTRLPNTRVAIKVAKDFGIVFLGDSVANDIWNAGIGALVAKEYPDTEFRFFLSTCENMDFLKCRDQACFDALVGRHKPNFVVICSSGRLNGAVSVKEAEDALTEIVARCKTIGAEVAISTPSANAEFRGEIVAERMGVQFWNLPAESCVTDVERDKVLNAMMMFRYFNAAQK